MTQVSFNFPPLAFSFFSADVRWFLIPWGDECMNVLVDVVKFSGYVFKDLQAEAGSVHPILQVDIRFLYAFRKIRCACIYVLPYLSIQLIS
jgi:hypothetical protein